MPLIARAGQGGEADAGAVRPNVLLIMTDDQGWGDIRSHGNDQIETPTLDRLAAEGARFDRFYVCPVCAPTRASLLTGRWHLRTGVWGVTHGKEIMRAEEVTVARVLKDAGYATGCFGKWHNGEHWPHCPNAKGFDEFLGFCAGHWNNYFDTTLDHNGEEVRTRGYISDVLTDAAIEFIAAHRNRPWFCYLPFNAPHGPFQVPEKYFQRCKARGLDDKTATIYAMVENADDNVARLLARLDDLGLAATTLVIFLTDNGPNSDRFNGGMRGRKGSVHEGGVRVPLFVRWPGRIRPGTTVARVASHVDLLPTIADYCGAKTPAGPALDGVSLRPLIEGRSEGWPDRALFTHQAGGAVTPDRGALRTDRWRLVREGKAYQLYDMIADPGQQRDAAADHPDVLADLRGRYEALFADVTRRGFDRIPVPVGHAQRPRVRMQAPEAILEGGARFRGKQGWANDWIVGLAGPEASAAWEVDVVRPGRYRPTLLYTCPQEDAGALVRVEAAGQAAEARVTRAHDPEPLPSPDRVPRGEVYEKAWAALDLDPLALPQGRTRLVVRPVDVPGRAAMELKAVVLARVD